MKQRLDQKVVQLGLVSSRSQAESYIKLAQVKVGNSIITKPGTLVDDSLPITVLATEQYVSRAGLKLASVATVLSLDFAGAVVLDVGSSTGGFTDFALRHGARKVFAVELGTDQLHPSLRSDPRIELYEKTDIRSVRLGPVSNGSTQAVVLSETPTIVVADVSFVSLRDILPSVATLTTPQTNILAMVKPQFEASQSELKHKGVIKNDRMRRDILKGFEEWAKTNFYIVNKADSDVAGAKGNRERFYLLRRIT